MTYNGSDKHKIALFENKQDKLTAGRNITLTPQQDGTVKIDAEGGGASSLSGLSDVNISSPTDGQALIYDGVRWRNRSIPIKIKDVVQNAQSMADENGIVDLSILTVMGDEINTILRYLGIEFYTDENGDEYTDENGLKYSSV